MYDGNPVWDALAVIILIVFTIILPPPLLILWLFYGLFYAFTTRNLKDEEK